MMMNTLVTTTQVKNFASHQVSPIHSQSQLHPSLSSQSIYSLRFYGYHFCFFIVLSPKCISLNIVALSNFKKKLVWFSVHLVYKFPLLSFAFTIYSWRIWTIWPMAFHTVWNLLISHSLRCFSIFSKWTGKSRCLTWLMFKSLWEDYISI